MKLSKGVTSAPWCSPSDVGGYHKQLRPILGPDHESEMIAPDPEDPVSSLHGPRVILLSHPSQ